MSVSDFVKEEEIVELTQRLVKIPSQYAAGEIAEHREILDFLRDTMSALGMETEIYEGGDPGYPVVVGRLRGESGKPALGFMGHYNTVPAGDPAEWTVDPFGGEIIDGKIYGNGAADMKSQIADTIIATKAVIDSGIKLKNYDLVLSIILPNKERYSSKGVIIVSIYFFEEIECVSPNNFDHFLI